MSAEDLGTRELGQVRSQRLDEVSFLFFLFSCFTAFTVFRLLTLFSNILWRDCLLCIESEIHMFVVGQPHIKLREPYLLDIAITFDIQSDSQSLKTVPGHTPLTTRSIDKFKDRCTCLGQASRQPHYSIRSYKPLCHTRTSDHRDH